MEGHGLFDKVKKGAKKVGKSLSPVGKALAPIVKEIGRDILPFAKEQAKHSATQLAQYAPQIGSTLGASALSGLAMYAGQPELVPLATEIGSKVGKAGGKKLGKMGEKELQDKPRPISYHPLSVGPI